MGDQDDVLRRFQLWCIYYIRRPCISLYKWTDNFIFTFHKILGLKKGKLRPIFRTPSQLVNVIQHKFVCSSHLGFMILAQKCGPIPFKLAHADTWPVHSKSRNGVYVPFNIFKDPLLFSRRQELAKIDIDLFSIIFRELVSSDSGIFHRVKDDLPDFIFFRMTVIHNHASEIKMQCLKGS